MSIRRFVSRIFLLAGALMTTALAGHAAAQGFPTRPITMIYPFPAGTAPEGVYRLINAEASKTLGQPVVVEVRPGANARLGINAVRNAPGDGYLLAIVNDSILVAQPIADAGFKIEAGKDYVPLGMQFEYPQALYGHPGLPFRDIKGLIAYAKANPGKINFASSPTTQFPAELLRQAADISVTFVPYKGGDMLLDMVAARVDLTITGATGAPFVKAGKLQVIATTGGQRWDPYPDVPTLKESGLQVDYQVWFALAASPGTPPAVVAVLSNAFALALKGPEVVKLLKTNGFQPSSRTGSKEFGEFIQSQFGVWEPVIRKAGIKIN